MKNAKILARETVLSHHWPHLHILIMIYYTIFLLLRQCYRNGIHSPSYLVDELGIAIGKHVGKSVYPV